MDPIRFRQVIPLGSNQLDHVLSRSKWGTSITNRKTKPGGIFGSDHKLIKIDLVVKLQITRRLTTVKTWTTPERAIF